MGGGGLVWGDIFVPHGLPKLRNIAAAADMLRAMGFRPARVWAAVAGAVEFFGGLLIIFGLFTQIAALLTAIEFLVVVFKKRSSGKLVGGYEFELLILVASFLLATIGGGSVSLDDTFRILLY